MARNYDDLFRQAERASDQIIAQSERAVILAYKESLKRIRTQLGVIYAKYAQGDTLTYAEMTKYNRLASMFDEINWELKSLYGRSINHLIKLGEDVYEASFFRTAYAIEAGGGPGAVVSINWGRLAPEAIMASVQNPISGLTLSERLASNRSMIITKIRQEVTQGLIQGESYPKMARRIKKTLDGDATKAMRVVRTEGHRNQQAGRLECIERAETRGVDLERVWSSTVDDRTRDDHQDMDGQVADKDGLFHFPSGGTTPAPGMSGIAEQDINCRCVVRAQIKGFAPKVRRIRGEGETAYRTFSDWKKAKNV